MQCISCGREFDGLLGERCDDCVGVAGTLGVGGQDLIVTQNESLPSVRAAGAGDATATEAGLRLSVSGVVSAAEPAVGGVDATMAALDALDEAALPSKPSSHITGAEHTLAALDVLDAAGPVPGARGGPPDGAVAGGAAAVMETAAALDVLDAAPPEADKLPCFEGKYQAERVLGRGGMGLVYFGRDKVLGRALAIKVTLPELGTHEEAKQRFLREAKTLANLDHPNIVPIYSYGWEGGSHYFVMKFVEGEPLDVVTKRTPLPERAELLLSLGPVFAALQHAHDVGIVHRDIKPPNIMFANDGTPMLLDFGIARDDSAVRLTQGDRTLGTPAYMSPEAALGNREAGAASDQYGLAVVCYELLTGDLPFMVPDPVAMLMQHIQLEPEPPHVRRPEIPPALSAVVLKAMAKAPEERYPSIAAFFDALREAIAPGRSLAELMGAGARLATPPPQAGGRPAAPAAPEQMATQPATGLKASPPADAGPSAGGGSPLKWVIVAALVLGLGGAGAWLALRNSGEPTPEVSPVPATVALSLTSAPPGATVTEGGQLLCKTPCRQTLPRAAQRTLRLELAGHVPQVLTLPFASDLERTVKLEPLPGAAPAATPEVPAVTTGKPDAGAGEKKPRRKRGRGRRKPGGRIKL